MTQRWLWLIGLGVAIALDTAVAVWPTPVAAVLHARHGWFEDPVPVEGDRPAEVVPGSVQAIGPSGIRYVVTQHGFSHSADRLTAVAADGRALWSKPTAGPVVLPHPAGAIVYVASEKSLDAIDAATGSIRWSITPNGRPRSLVINSREELCASRYGAVRCFGADGAELWKSEESLGGDLLPGPNATLFASENPRLTVFGGDGKVLAKIDYVSAGIFDSRRQTLYATSRRALVWLSAAGVEQRRVTLDADPFGVAVGEDGTVYVSTGTLNAISPNGESLWQFRPRDYLTSVPVIDVTGDVLVAGRRRLFALRPDGTVRWRTQFVDAFTQAPAIMAADNGVYLRGSSSALVARPGVR